MDGGIPGVVGGGFAHERWCDGGANLSRTWRAFVILIPKAIRT